MKRLYAVIAVSMLSAFALGQSKAAKPCEELKTEISKKMEANGVKTPSLEVVSKDKEVEGKVVGTCEGGTKKIIYRKGVVVPVVQEKK